MKKDNFLAMEALKKLIEETHAHYILLSYSSGGRTEKEELMNIISSTGKLLKALEIDYRKNVMANMRWTNEWIRQENRHYEYLFLLEKI